MLINLLPAKTTKRTGAHKMAVNNIANEIMSVFAQGNYCEYVHCLSERDAVNIETFKYTPMGRIYWIDLRRCFITGKQNPNQVLEMFSDYSGFEPAELRKRIVTILKTESEVPLWSDVGNVVLGLNFTTYSEWVEYMSENDTPCDELMLYVLSRIHCRHTVVLTSNRAWTTVKADGNTTVDDLLHICDIRLVYLGSKTFGELKRLPMSAPPLPLPPPIPIANPSVKSRKGRLPSKPLDLSKKSLMKKSKKKPNVNAPGRVFINQRIDIDSNEHGIMDPRSQLTMSHPPVAEVPTPVFDKKCLNSSHTQPPAADDIQSTSSQGNIQLSIVDDRLNSSNTYTTVVDDIPSTVTQSDVVTVIEHGKNPASSLCYNSSDSQAVVPTGGSNSSNMKLLAVPAPTLLSTVDTAKGTVVQSSVADVSPGSGNDTIKSDIVVSLKENALLLPETASRIPSLKNIVNCYLKNKLNMEENVIYNYIVSIQKTPLSLKDQAIKFLNRQAPDLDTDKALTKTLKFNMLRKYDIKTHKAPPEVDVNVLLKNLALKRKTEVIVPKVDKRIINRWTKKVPHWSELDPYTDLEDEGITHNGEETDVKCSDSDPINDGVYFTRIGGHVLRKRQRAYHSERNRRLGTEHKFYRNMCQSPSDTKKPKKKRIPPRKQPSNSRVKAQYVNKNKNKSDQETKSLVRSYPLFDLSNKNKTKTESTRSSTMDDYIVESDHDQASDSDTIPYVPDPGSLKDVVEELKQLPKKSKGKLITKTYGIRNSLKNKSGRKYKCINCVSSYDSVASLNSHFKNSHPPLQCKICKKFLNTPSTLTRHMFIHRELRYKCDHCPKKFAFKSDRDTHHISHRKIKTFMCNSAKCGKTFFFEGDLTKHVKTHREIKWRCKYCKYWSNDERNLKAHQRLHSNLKPYLCENCLQLFKYNEQLKRHRAKPGECEKLKKLASSRSKSPEY